MIISGHMKVGNLCFTAVAAPGVGMGAFALPSLAPSQKGKKGHKSEIWGKFLDFCPRRNEIFPLSAPTKKK